MKELAMSSSVSPVVELEQSSPIDEADETYLRDRLSKPQRHRLLHGYPLAAAMPHCPESKAVDLAYDAGTGRGLLVGILPHPFCNPAVTGCGFCTFQHESYNHGRATEVVECVMTEIEGRLARQPTLHRRRVAALYFGGGTANLTPAGPFRELCRKLTATFDLSSAEITLEGVPAYFVKRQPLLMDILQEEIRARHFRLSMGVQTFDEKRLSQMGRLAFGTAETFAQVVAMAHDRGFTASADLLFNLPEQSLAEMSRDVEEALRLGLDHLGLYHLVLFRGLGTAWSREPAMLAGLPSNERAAENWLMLRQLVLAADFVQTTLTNFERANFRGDDRRFVYEELSFEPEHYDMIGFGPGAISFAANRSFDGAAKVLNPDSAAAYLAGVRRGQSPCDRYFDYDPMDLRIFYLTRRLAALEVDRRQYKRLFRSDPLIDFASELRALLDEGLVEVSPTAIRPTPRGMFYADSIAAQLARRKIYTRRSSSPRTPGAARDRKDANHSAANDNGRGHM
jgi:oxygen-independent coproporphyrinogen-3 oxidase